MLRQQRRLAGLVVWVATAVSSSSSARLLVVLHATTEVGVERGVSVLRRPPASSLVTLWLGVDRPDVAGARRYPAEVEGRGAAARIVFGLGAALEGVAASDERRYLVSLDLDKWSPCRRFASLERPLPRAAGASVAVSEARREGHWAAAELGVVVATWTRPVWVRRYVAAAKRVLERDAETPPLSWLPSSATDVALEARHKLEAKTGDLAFDDLPETLACAGDCSDDRCLGALPARQPPPASLAAATDTLLKKVLLDDDRLERCVLTLSEDVKEEEKDTRLGKQQPRRPEEEESSSSSSSSSSTRPPPPVVVSSSVEVVIVSGVNVRSGPNGEADVDLALSKRAYAKRRGYAFAFYVADTFNEALLANSAQGGKALPWEFAKILMIADAGHRYPKARWICWIDADAWVNPRFAALPLTLWLDDAPRDRLAILSNFRGLNTGVVALRGGPRGRAFVAAWLAVARSGLAQCHPHDQAAFQMLQLWHLNGSHPEERFPFGFDCRKTPKGNCGTHPNGEPSKHWSCIPLWLNAIKRARPAFSHLNRHHQDIDDGQGLPDNDRPRVRRPLPKQRYPDVADVVDRGDANPEIAPFYVATENAERPRLQCFRCVKGLDVLEQYPGKNFPRKNPTTDRDGWLVDHKGQHLFYRQAFRSQSDDPERPCFVSNKTVTHFKP